MQVALDAKVVALIRRKVASGRSVDAGDVIRDAMRHLDERARRRQELHAALAIGFEELERGEGIE